MEGGKKDKQAYIGCSHLSFNWNLTGMDMESHDIKNSYKIEAAVKKKKSISRDVSSQKCKCVLDLSHWMK